MITREQAIDIIQSFLNDQNKNRSDQNKLYVDYEEDFIEVEHYFGFTVHVKGQQGAKLYLYDDSGYSLDRVTGEIKESTFDPSECRSFL